MVSSLCYSILRTPRNIIIPPILSPFDLPSVNSSNIKVRSPWLLSFLTLLIPLYKSPSFVVLKLYLSWDTFSPSLSTVSTTGPTTDPGGVVNHEVLSPLSVIYLLCFSLNRHRVRRVTLLRGMNDSRGSYRPQRLPVSKDSKSNGKYRWKFGISNFWLLRSDHR